MVFFLKKLDDTTTIYIIESLFQKVNRYNKWPKEWQKLYFYTFSGEKLDFICEK
jgi:hypothetical protein